jgi:F-type H+-transporting ATPase subunit b
MIRLRLDWLVLALFLLCVSAGDVLGAPTGNEKAGSGPFRGTLDVAVWTIVVFLGLFFVLRAYAWGPIQAGLEKRERDAVAAAEAAQLARMEAQAIRDQFQKEKDEAARKVAELIEEARRDATRLAEEMKAQAQAEIATERERLKREVGVARDQALNEIWQKAASLATQVSARILPRELSDVDQRRLIEFALNDLQGQGDDLQALLKSREL